MPSKQQDVVKPNILSVLFMTVDGEPMSFYLRPGPVKRKLQPLITAGGGLLCNVQQPGAILLIDPEERGSIPETTAHWYVSTQYIHDCIEKDEQLNLEDYRLNPEVVQRQSARLSNSKEDSPGLLGGRVAYTPEEDAAILNYVSKHKTETGGNRLWQQMEKQRVTSHSWQSMKYRYRVRLAQKQSEVETTEEEIKEEENEETEDAAPPQTHSVETDLTPIDAEHIPAENSKPENIKAQTSSSPQQQVQRVDPQTDEQPAEGTQVETVEAGTSNSPQPEEPRVDPQIEAIPAESTEPKTDVSPTTISPEKENTPEDSPPAQPEPLPKTSSPKKPKEKENTSPKLVRPQRRSTRRQLELEEAPSSQPYSKKLRSAASSVEEMSVSPQPLKKTKSANRSASQKDTTVDQPPPKKARGKSGTTVAESQQEETVQASVSETVQADEESDSVPQTGEKTKEKRKLGILELATKEFEDESGPEDEAPHLQKPAETAADPLLRSSDTAADAASAQSNPEPGTSLRENVEEAQASRNNRPETCCPQPAAAQPAAAQPAAAQPAATEPASAQPATAQPAAAQPAATEPASAQPATAQPAAAQPAAAQPAAAQPAAAQPAAAQPAAAQPAATEPAAAQPAAAEVVKATSKAHLFIFDSESQEEDSQSVVGDSTAAEPQPTVNKEAALSLTQVQLEEDKQRIRELISQTNQDLICVTKALLKTSGDFSAALDLLLTPSSFSGPFWNRRDDELLLSADPAVRQQLQEKYGEEDVAKRIVFLEVER